MASPQEMARRAIPGTPRFSSMACDQIQVPTEGRFTSADLLWYSETAWIPITCLEDFICGEEQMPLTLCKLKKKVLPTRTSVGTTTTLYSCHWGPVDLRGKVVAKAPRVRTTVDGKRPVARSTELGESLNRGCQCHFAVVQYIDRKEAVLLRWISRHHLDKGGCVCHGLMDPKALFVNAHIDRDISRTLRDFVERLLLSKVDPVNIVLTHNRMVKEQLRTDDFGDAPHIWARDMQLQLQDVINISNAMKAKLGYKSPKDHVNVALWAEANLTKVIHYDPGCDDPFRPFAFVCASRWQLWKLATLGHQSVVAMDATFGTNEYEFQLFTLLVFDEFQQGIPCCWAILERHSAIDLTNMLNQVKAKVEEIRVHPKINLEKEWKPNSFIIDCAPEEALAIRNALPQVEINLCFYHVRRSWKKNLHGKVRCAANKTQMNRELGDMMYNRCASDPITASLEFMERWTILERDFVSYYKKNWHGKLVQWVKAYRTFPHANQNTNGGIERYHRTLKSQLKVEKKVKLGWKVAWLIQILNDDVEHWYWMKSGQKIQGKVRNTVAEDILMEALDKASLIPDEDVVFVDMGAVKSATVVCQSNRDLLHVVIDWDTDACTCTCSQAIQNNTCKHQIKLLIMTGWGEVELWRRLGTKWGTLCGGLDYAASRPGGAPDLCNILVIDPEYLAETTQGSIHIEETPQQVEGGPELAAPQSVERSLSKEDLLRFVDKAFDHFGTNPRMMNHAFKGIKDWYQKLRDIDARIDPANPNDIQQHMELGAHPFRRPDGASLSLRPRESFVDKIGKKTVCRGRPSAPQPIRTDLRELKKPKVVKETMQQYFDRLEKEEFDASLAEAESKNIDPDLSQPNSQQSSARSRGRGGRRGRGRGRGRSSNPMVLTDINLNIHVVMDSQLEDC